MTKYKIAAVIVLGFGSVAAANGQEQTLQKKDLPKAVQATVDPESTGATIKGFSKEKEGGILTYEAQLIVDGHSRDISMDAKGNVLEVEEQVTLDSLPEPVRTGLTKGAAGGTITKVESLTKKGRLVAYEAAVTNGKKHSEVQVAPDGKRLAKEE